MSDIISLQSLMGSVSGLKQFMEAARLSVLSSYGNSTNSNSSEHHLKFNELISKYSRFAEEYRFELDQFHKLLSNNIELQQQKEKERLERLEKLEIVSNSNSNLEISENLTECDYSSATEQKQEEEEENNSSFDQQTDPEPVPVPTPVPIKSKPVKKVKSVKKDKTQKKVKKNISRKTAPSNKPKVVKNNNLVKNNNNNNDEKENNDKTMDKPYKYNLDNINWRFNGIQRSSTMIYIGNLPNGIKVAAIQFFVMKKAKVTMRQIEETKLKQGSKGMFGLVRFRSDVSIDRVIKFMNDINSRNTEIAEERKKESMKLVKKKTNKTSWQRRVFLKFNQQRKYYDDEYSMYNDKNAVHTLFIRNFDILDRKCHYNLTHQLLEFGDLYKNIEIRVDSFGDPYCTVTFKYINDAIYCCNSEINFSGRTLEIRYSKF